MPAMQRRRFPSNGSVRGGGGGGGGGPEHAAPMLCSGGCAQAGRAESLVAVDAINLMQSQTFLRLFDYRRKVVYNSVIHFCTVTADIEVFIPEDCWNNIEYSMIVLNLNCNT
jgi:hypothetical protein